MARNRVASAEENSSEPEAVAEESTPGVVEEAVIQNEAPAVRAVPLFTAEGVLLNPADCVVGPDGVVVGK